MANEILHSSMESDLRMPSMLTAAIRILLADNADLRSLTPYLGSINRSLSDTHGVRFAGLDADDFVSATEIEDAANVALTDASVNIAVTRSVLKRQASDLARITSAGGDSDPETMAASFVRAYLRHHASLLCTAGAGASSTVGTSGVNMSVDDFHDAVYTLELADVPAEMVACVLHNRQFADLQESLRAEGGAMAFQTGSGLVPMLSIQSTGLQGAYLGVQVWRSSYVTAATGNRYGFMFDVGGGFGWKDGTIPSAPGRNVISMGGGLHIEFDGDASAAISESNAQVYKGLSLLEQSRVVGIVTDQ